MGGGFRLRVGSTIALTEAQVGEGSAVVFSFWSRADARAKRRDLSCPYIHSGFFQNTRHPPPTGGTSQSRPFHFHVAQWYAPELHCLVNSSFPPFKLFYVCGP